MDLNQPEARRFSLAIGINSTGLFFTFSLQVLHAEIGIVAAPVGVAVAV